jgi:hypothetical protein
MYFSRFFTVSTVSALVVSIMITIPSGYGAGGWPMALSALLGAAIGAGMSSNKNLFWVSLAHAMPSSISACLVYASIMSGNLFATPTAAVTLGFLQGGIPSFCFGLSQALLRQSLPLHARREFDLGVLVRVVTISLPFSILLAIIFSHIKSTPESYSVEISSILLNINLFWVGKFGGESLGESAGQRVGFWVRPSLITFDDIWPFIRAMTFHMIGFSFGYLFTVLCFGGLYAALHRMDPQGSFQQTATEKGWWDFSFFSMMTITTLGYSPIVPDSVLAQILAFVEAWIGAAWWAIVLAAFLAQLTPQFEALTRRTGRGRKPKRISPKNAGKRSQTDPENLFAEKVPISKS